MRRDLTRRAINALLYWGHAHLGGRTVGSRAKRLPEIAAAYTRDELLREPGIGPATVVEIELWLEERGLKLRLSEHAAPDIKVEGNATPGGDEGDSTSCVKIAPIGLMPTAEVIGRSPS